MIVYLDKKEQMLDFVNLLREIPDELTEGVSLNRIVSVKLSR